MKLSITLATYNVEDFIQQCLDSIINQSFTDFELICIDDGSTDGTLFILNEYQKLDNRIVVVKKKQNEGLAVARNLSLSLAKGEYITFLDGDDIYDLTLFKKAIEKAEIDNSDMVVWDYVTFYTTNQIERLKEFPSEIDNINVHDKEALLKRPAFTGIKLLKTEKIKELGVYFPKGMTRQDIPVHWLLVTKLDKISIIPERLTYYRQQNNATTSKRDQRLFDLIYVMDIVEKYLIDNDLLTTYKTLFLTQRLNFLHGVIDRIDEKYKSEALEIIKSRISVENIKFLKNKNNVRLQAKFFILGINGSKWNKFLFNLWIFTRTIYRKFKKNYL